jgi:hypothetical protein
MRFMSHSRDQIGPLFDLDARLLDGRPPLLDLGLEKACAPAPSAQPSNTEDRIPRESFMTASFVVVANGSLAAHHR